MKSRTLSFKISLIAGLALVAAIVTVSIVPRAGSADVWFRQFRDDTSRFEGYADRAKREDTLADWDRTMRIGREGMKAEWECDAEFKIAAELRSGADTPENSEALKALRNVKRAEWERDFEAAEAVARGSWYARREGIIRQGFDDQWLKDELVKSDAAVTGLAGQGKVDAWDADISPDARVVKAQWESSLGSLLHTLREKGDALDAESRKSYENEIVKIEQELRDRFRLEKNSLVYSHRNRIIWDSLVDHESLRYKSEADSASAIADEILTETRETLSKEEEKVLGAKQAGETAPMADFSNLGSDWERQIRELMEKGLSRWQKAQEDLLARMTSWKKGSEEALRDGEEAWQTAYNRLFDARKEWQKDLETEINAGIEAWKKRDEDLAKNLEQAKHDLTSYMETMKGQWEGQSSGLADTMLTGSHIYGEAVDNIAWLSQMAARYATKGAYATGDLFSGVTDWTAWQAQQDRLKKLLVDDKVISESDPPLWITAKFEGVTYDDPNDQAVERYTVTLWRGFFNATNETITWYNLISDASVETEKTPYFFYMREIDRWEQMRDEFSKLVGDAETAAHDANMAGIEGPGFLKNVMRAYGLNPEGENDPYLMTRAEFDFALAERERNYWRARLAVAKDVLDYAFAEGPRESAAETETRKADAETAMNDAKTAYEASLGAIKGINEEMARIKGTMPTESEAEAPKKWAAWRTSISYLSGELEMRKGALAKTEEEYQKYAQALIVLENGQDADFMRREIVSLQSSLLATEKALDDARSAYFTSLRAAEGVDRMAQYAERANSLVYARMQARRDFDAYRGIVTGAESDTSLESWGTALLVDANTAAVWTGREERRAALAERYRSWKDAGDGEREARKEEFAAALREEYLSREIFAAAGDTALGDFLNADFDPEYYRTNYNETFGEGDRAVLLEYASITLGALELVEGAMKKVPKGERNLIALMEKLPVPGSYVYGGDNRDFIMNEAARRWTAERFADIDDAKWDIYADTLTKELEHAEALVDMYDDFTGFESGYQDLVEKAKSGDEAAQKLVVEYAEMGSTLAIAGSLAAYDAARAKHREVETARKAFADEFGDYYAFSDAMARAADHVTAMIDYVNRGFGGGFMFSEDLSERTAEELAGAARLMASYAAAMQTSGKPVSAAMLKIAQELEAVAGEMDELLYVRDHAGDLNYREALSARESESAVSDGAFRHVDYAEEVLSGQVSASEYGYGDASYNILKTVLEARSVLDAGTKEFLASHGSGDTAEYENFLTDAASLLDTYEIRHLALQFVGLGGGMILDDFVATAVGSRGDVFKSSLRDYIADICLVDGALPADPDMLAAISLGITADIGAASELMEQEILLGRALAPRAMEELGGENDVRRRDAARARRLVAYHDIPAAFSSYRTNLTAVSALEAGAAGDLVVSQIPDGSTGFDRRDASGNIVEIFYAVPDAEGRALGSMILEASNALASRMGEMFAAARPAEAADGELASVGQYLARLTAAFDPNRTYAYNDGYEFDAALTALYDEATTVHAAKGTATLAGAEGEISSLTATIAQREADVIQRASVYGVMGEKKELLRSEMDAAGKVRGDLQAAYSKNAADLADAQGRYQAANMKYIDGMNAVSSSYTTFQGAELMYERAYAVWEYAHTPYLHDTAAKEGGAGQGALPGGETADLTAVPAPDAKERYARVKASFDAAEMKLAASKTALDSQETVEDLAGDAEYQAAREEFRAEAESYARTARAASMVEEELGIVKAKVDLWQGKYTSAKENMTGLNKVGMTDTQKSQRDIILGRMVQYVKDHGNNIQSYVDILIREHNLRGGIAYLSNPANYESWYDPQSNSWHRNIAALQNEYRALMTNINTKDIMADIQYLRTNDLNYSNLIEKMATDYYSYKIWYNKYEYANSKCGSKNPVTRRRWRNNRDHRRNQYRVFYTAYEGSQTIISSYFLNVIDSRSNLETYQAQLSALDMVRSAKEFRDTTLAKEDYALEGADRARIHDALDGRTNPGAGDLNINGLRHMAQRKDIDGYAVKVKRTGDTLQVLDREGKVTGSYALGDASVILTSDEAGSSILAHADLAEGAEAYLTDYVYSSLDVTRALTKALTDRRAGTKQALEGYAATSSHDRTVVLRDLESLHHALLLQAASVGTALPATIREAKPRSFDGYAKAVSDLVYDGSGGSVDDRIVKELMAQNGSFQNQNWSFLAETYTQKKQSWMETAAFVRTRGERDWADNLYTVENAWRTWSMETRAAIAQGVKDWEKAQGAYAASQERWKVTTAVDSADAAAEMLGRDLEADIRASVEAVNAGLPKSLALSFDAESLYQDAMKKAPKADLGALAKSMLATNTTAGFTNMLNLGLSGNLAQSVEKQLQAFENGMSVMKNLRMSEVIYNMMDGFDAQLAEANTQNYDTVLTGLAVNYEAPFVRNRDGRQWNIQVVEDYNLTEGADYHTIRFADYQNYQNSTVKLKSLRSLTGGSIDFGDPATYNRIDARELEMYVKLETDHLNKEIEKVFGNGDKGLFTQYSQGEFARLQNEFNDAYSDYLAGEAMQGGDWYRTPIFKGGPDPMTAAKIGACLAGPWAAFAVTAVMLAVDTKDGVIAGKHALMQGAVGFAAGMAGPGGIFVNVAASGIDYEANGSVGWDNDMFREGAIRNAASYALSSTLTGALGPQFANSTLGAGLISGVSTGLMNGVQITSTGWGDLDLDYDKANWRESVVVGAASGISAMINKSMSGKGNTGTEQAQANNLNGTSSYPEQWGSGFAQKVITGGINSMLMTAAYLAMDGKGFKNDYSHMNWNNMTYSAYDLGNFLGSQANSFVKDYAKNKTGKLGDIRINAENTSMDGKSSGDGPGLFDSGMSGLATLLEYSDKGDAALKGVIGKIGEYGVKGVAGLGSLAVDGLSAAWKGVTGMFASSPTQSTQLTAEMMKDTSMQRWVVDMMYRDKDFAKMADQLGVDKELIKIGVDKNTIDSYQENRSKNYVKDQDGILSPTNHREYADYFDAKLRLSKELGEDYAISLQDKADLVRTVQQKDGASISQELAGAIKGNAEYKKMLQDKGVVLNSVADITKYANKVAHDACVNANLWVSLKVAGANVENYYGDFYMKNVERKELFKDNNGVFLLAPRDSGGIDYQRVANNYNIDGSKIEVVRGSDYKSFLQDIKNYNMVVRGSWGHNMSIFNGKLYDTGLAGRTWGGNPRDYITQKKELSSYYYIKSLN